jgi:Secretion system C-terminal sorting domain
MKNLTPKIPFVIFLISFGIVTCPFLSIGQKNILDSSRLNSIQFAKPTEVICDRPQSTVCNLIENNIFNTTCFGLNPFWENCISRWNSLHGSPQLNVFGPQLSTGVNHASMWAQSEQWPNGQQFFGGEGIVTGIPKLIPGKKYAFSMFKRYFSAPQAPTVDLDNFYIVLMKCVDYLPLRTSEPRIPIIPDVAQIIYCEKDLTNNSFQRVMQTFTAQDEYDIVWLFPKELTYVAGQTKQSWLEVAKFEMINIDNFSAGVSPNPIIPNCAVTIGPNVPNCGVEGAVFTWYGPNGQIIPAPANQQIQLNTSNSANTGNWTLKMTVPNVVTTNNTCSGAGIVQASVNVPACVTCAPVITPAGPIDYYTPVDAGPNGRLLTSSITTGNQWYFNNIAIANAVTQSYNIKNQWGDNGGGDYYVINNGCKSNIVHVDFKHYGYGRYGEENLNRLGAKIHPIQTSNYYCFNSTNNLIRQFDLGPSAYYVWNFPVTPIGGVPNITLTPGSYNPNSNQAQVNIGGSLGTVMPYVQGIANLNGREIIIDYYHILSHSIYISTNQQVCANAGQTITNFAISSLKTIPGGSGFDWEEYDFGPTGTIFSGPGAGQRSVIIPGRSNPQAMTVKFTGNSFVQKRFYYNWGGCYEEKYNVTIYNGCRVNTATTSLKTNIFPNPATSQLTIVSSESISDIEISDLQNPTLKKIKVNGTKSTTIDVLDLNPGVYNCKIITSKGVENQKLIIKR